MALPSATTTKTHGEQTQALARILSALSTTKRSIMGAVRKFTENAIQDERDAWERALPTKDVVFARATTHDVYRSRASRLIDSAPNYLPRR